MASKVCQHDGTRFGVEGTDDRVCAPSSNTPVVLEDVAYRSESPVMSIGRRQFDVSQGRRLEFPQV